MNANLEVIFFQYFSKQQGASIAVWLLANEEMTINEIVRYVVPFKNPQKRAEFQAREFDYSDYRLKNAEHIPFETSKYFAQQIFIQDFKKKFIERMNHIDCSPESLIQTKIQQEMNSILFDLKLQHLENQPIDHQQGMLQYLMKLIEIIFDKYFQDLKQGMAENIINYGGIESVLTSDPFNSDFVFKNRFKSILYNCKTFKEVRSCGGKDIHYARKKLASSILKRLFKLEFNEQLSKYVCDQLLERPHSYIVADCNDLTNRQKIGFYDSELGRQLREYGNIRYYEDSLQFKAKQDITKIISFIEDQSRITNQIITSVLNFDLYNLLKARQIRHIRKPLYRLIIEECPFFIKAFKLVKYMHKDPHSLKENDRINLKMDLIDLFFNIRLPFEIWQNTQAKILARDYSAIKNLALDDRYKFQLIEYFFKIVEPYFHFQEKAKIGYRYEVEHALLYQLMNADFADATDMQSILNIVNQTLDSENYESRTLLQQHSRRDQRSYYQSLNRCEAYKQYKANKRRDIKEEQYLIRLEQMRSMCEGNCQHITENIKVQNHIQERQQNIFDASNKFVTIYLKENENSIFQKMLREKFNNDAVKMIKKMFESDLLENEDTSFFKQLGFNNLLVWKLKMELAKNAEFLTNSLNQIKYLFVSQEIVDYIGDNGRREQRFEALANEFMNRYVECYEESMLQRVLNTKFDGNRVELVRQIIKLNAFENDSSEFFTNLALNGLLNRRVRREFESNRQFARNYLQRCRQFMPL